MRHEVAIFSCLLRELTMRTTIVLDDELLARATDLTGIVEKAPLLREALAALIARESAKRLALLGGSDPAAVAPPRRRPEAA
jgi:Arc/MetJ family transcription regulator